MIGKKNEDQASKWSYGSTLELSYCVAVGRNIRVFKDLSYSTSSLRPQQRVDCAILQRSKTIPVCYRTTISTLGLHFFTDHLIILIING